MTGFIELITSAQVLVGFVIVAAIVALSGYSLWHAMTTPEQAFVVEGKRSRVFWAALNALALGVSFLALTPTGPVGIFGALMMLIIPGVYLTDVRPAVSSYRRKRGNGGYQQRPPTPW